MPNKRNTEMRGATTKRCANASCPHPQPMALASFPADVTQPLGAKARCFDCYNQQQQERRAKPAVRARNNASQRGTLARNVNENSARAEAAVAKAADASRKLIAEQERAAKKVEAERARDHQRADASRARLSNEYAQLRPEDFAVGIANDPASRGLSKEASAEKRQEYSAAMGTHLENTRRAAVAAANGRDLLESMPASTAEYIANLSEQERRFGNRRLARSVSLFAAGEELARRLWMQACDQYLTGRVQATGYAKKPCTTRIKRSVVILLSDLHLGAELSRADNPQPFRAIEEARRLEYVLRQAIDYKPQYRKDTEFVLLLNGDVIEGLLLHDFRDGAPLTEQRVVFQRYMERFVAELARAFPSGRVFMQPGNHGRNRLRHPGRATSSKWDGVESDMYYALARSCAALKNVKWQLGFRAISTVDLHGQNLLLTHADTEVLIGDPDSKATANRATIDKINATRIYGHEYAAGAFGHYHKPRFLPGKPALLFNGALIPPNGHARSNGWIGESCGQWIFEAVENYPIGDARFIVVGEAQDRDERLGSVIQPFRFDLENGEGFPV
jgi:hypothetical protein